MFMLLTLGAMIGAFALAIAIPSLLMGLIARIITNRCRRHPNDT